MHINDNLSNGEKQNTIKTPHMFQKAYVETKILNDDLDSQVSKNMSKIAKSFKSDQNVLNLDNDKSLVVSTNKLIEINLLDSTKSLYDYFEELRRLMNPKEEIKVIVEVESLVNEKVADKVVNIDEIIKNSEKLLFNSRDKKTLLKDLINDVSSNSEINFTYNDEKFEQNIKEMLSEINEDDDNQDTILIEAIEPIIDNDQNIKKSKLPIFLVLTILILLCVALYIYKDIIISLLP
ncbi:MAG: hypothetical protein K0Q49_841 [Haloplasmataceae bacterium]|jgi:hypothetical protein|nr:hypothetical protein [Haloplasmataceae bacterium]